MIQHADIGDLAVNGFLLELDFSDKLKSAFHESAFTSFEVKDKQYGIDILWKHMDWCITRI